METKELNCIEQRYREEYRQLHKSVCLNLGRIIWNIAFLKKAKEAQDLGVICRNDFIIEHLYKNEFELLILRLNRTFFDNGEDAATLPRLKNNLFSKYLLKQHKKGLSELLRDSTWDLPEIVAARRRLEDAVPIFRNNYIAHTLLVKNDEISVSFLDAEKVIMAACELFNKLGYGLDTFYLNQEKFYLNFEEEKKACEKYYEQFFLFQQTSAFCIKNLQCEFNNDKSSKIVKEKIDKINLILEEF